VWHLASGFAKAAAKLRHFFRPAIYFVNFFRVCLKIIGFWSVGIKIESICYTIFSSFFCFSLNLHGNHLELNNKDL